MGRRPIINQRAEILRLVGKAIKSPTSSDAYDRVISGLSSVKDREVLLDLFTDIIAGWLRNRIDGTEVWEKWALGQFIPGDLLINLVGKEKSWPQIMYGTSTKSRK